jgi:dTDP-4-dehydrorhamnose reductase
MRILVTGAGGFVGKKIMSTLEGAVASPTLRGCDQDDINRIVEESGADAIIHTAAISDMGICESNPAACRRANVDIPVMLAKAAGGRKLVCFSSDQVYNNSSKKGPYTEDDIDAYNLYGNSKINMEKKVSEIDPDAVFLRAEWMYDHNSLRPNYLHLLLNSPYLAFSSREYRGVTYLREVAENMEKTLTLPGGAYNFGSETDESIYEITRKIVSHLGLDVKVEDREPGHNLWMDCSKARSYGIEFSSVYDGLVKCAEDYGI